MNEVPAPDDLHVLLTPSTGTATDAMRAQIQQRTSRQVRNRLFVRRGRLLIALAACYLAGLATIDVLRSRTQPVGVGIVPTKPERTIVLVPVERPGDVELRAEQAQAAEQAQVYFAAGRRYAKEAGDWDSALRCYRNALDADPNQADRLDPDNDDWLAMALKLDRQKEKENAKHEN